MLIPTVHPKLAVLLESESRGLGALFPLQPATKEISLLPVHGYRETMDIKVTGFTYDMRPVLLGTAGRGSRSSTETEIDHLKLTVLVTVLDLVAVPTSAS